MNYEPDKGWLRMFICSLSGYLQGTDYLCDRYWEWKGLDKFGHLIKKVLA